MGVVVASHNHQSQSFGEKAAGYLTSCYTPPPGVYDPLTAIMQPNLSYSNRISRYVRLFRWEDLSLSLSLDSELMMQHHDGSRWKFRWIRSTSYLLSQGKNRICPLKEIGKRERIFLFDHRCGRNISSLFQIIISK